jgi:putative peptidoglycan lipid II flippase
MSKSNREHFIRNTVFNTSFNLLNQLVALFILPLFIKNIGAEMYGIWIISGIALGYLGLIDLGFTEGIMRYISVAFIEKDSTKLNKAINTFLVLLFAMGTFILLIILLFSENILRIFAIQPENFKIAKNLILVTGFFAPFVWATKITKTTFQGILRFKEVSILSGIQSFGVTLTMLYLVYNGFNIVNIAFITNIINLVLWVPSVSILFKVLPDLSFAKKYISFSVIKETMPFGMGVFYSQLIALLALQADNMIIGIAVSMSAVTAYVVASKLFYTTYSYMGMLSGVLQPTSYHAFANQDRSMIDKLLTQGTKYMTFLYTPIGYLGIIISPMFIEAWMGAEYLQYAIWSQAFMAVFVLTSGFGIPVNLVFNSGNTKAPNILKTVSILLNLSLGILLVKKLGIGGPILGTLISGFLGPLTFPYFCKLLGADWKKHGHMVLKIILINLPSSIFFYWVSLILNPTWINLIWLSLIILIVQFYTLYIVFFNIEEKNDINIFFKMLNIFKLIITKKQ